MAHPYHHALSSVKKWGGTIEDTIALHSWFDASKEITADFRHHALRHHAEGIFMAETIFGPTLTLSTGRVIPTRWVGEQHVREDLGFHTELRRLGEGDPARALDGPGGEDRGRGRPALHLTCGGGWLRCRALTNVSACRRVRRRARSCAPQSGRCTPTRWPYAAFGRRGNATTANSCKPMQRRSHSLANSAPDGPLVVSIRCPHARLRWPGVSFLEAKHG